MAYLFNTSMQSHVQSSYTKLPLLIKSVIFFTLAASLIQGNVLGFNVSGLCWVIPCILSAIILSKRLPMVSFPTVIWLPWILLLGFHLALDDKTTLDPAVSPLQRTFQVLTPILVGMASSTYRPSAHVINRFISLLRIMSYILMAGSIGLSFEQILANTPTGLAPQVMSALLLAIVFANRFLFFKQSKDLVTSLMLALLPLLAITRTVLAVMLLVFPTAFAPISWIKRLLAIATISMLGVWIFYLPQIQHKMFYSGYGDLTDIFTTQDFATTGRSSLWEVLFSEAQTKHWMGHGIGGAETAARYLTGLAYPHNDWLLTYYDLGLLGVAIFLLSNVMMLKHGYSASKKSNQVDTKFLFCAGISMFLPFMLVMWTDNVMVYSPFFGNLQYSILGFAYGALRKGRGSRANLYQGLQGHANHF
ncbi:MAG: O-antigen ligase family protein [Legionellaceae bacterium]|nr:O-antigen ligase family protein [Legionellaceae bacterium]